MSEQKPDKILEKQYEIIPVKSARDYRSAIRNGEVLESKIAMMLATENGTEADINELRELSDKQQEQLKAFRKCINVYNSKYLCDNLIKIAEDFGLRISDLDDILGLSNGYIARTLKPDSKKRLSIDVVANLAALFKVNVDDLINRPLFESSPDMKLVIEFLERLKERIASGTDSWRRLFESSREYLALFEGADDNTKGWYRFYLPFPDDDFLYELRDVYYAKTGNEGLYIVCLKSEEGQERYDVIRAISKCYDIEGKMYPSEEIEGDSLKIVCDTSDDPSGVLKQEVKTVVNVICTHLLDYTVTEDAKNFMAAFIKGTDDRKRKSAAELKEVGDV